MELPKEIVEYAQKVCAKTASLIADEMSKTAKYAIDAFYNDYTPNYYKRHYYNFSKNSYKRFYQNRHGKKFVGGIELTPENMDDIYKYPTESVYHFVYDYGYHGLPLNNTPVMSPTPMEILLDKQKEIINNLDKYINKAQEIVG